VKNLEIGGLDQEMAALTFGKLIIFPANLEEKLSYFPEDNLACFASAELIKQSFAILSNAYM
jgi:hypothetical protein